MTGAGAAALAGGAGIFGIYSVPGWPQPASMVVTTTGNIKYNARDDFTIRIRI
jgi:hypothetical protein